MVKNNLLSNDTVDMVKNVHNKLTYMISLTLNISGLVDPFCFSLMLNTYTNVLNYQHQHVYVFTKLFITSLIMKETKIYLMALKSASFQYFTEILYL